MGWTDDVRRRDLHHGAHAAGRLPGERQEAVVRTDEMAAADRLDSDLAILADIRLDDAEHHGGLGDVRHRVGEEDRARGDLERANEV